MAIRVVCPVCRHRGVVPDRAMEKRVVCPACGFEHRLTKEWLSLTGCTLAAAEPVPQAGPPLGWSHRTRYGPKANRRGSGGFGHWSPFC